jgi:Na+-driven multidrug efflux pump
MILSAATAACAAATAANSHHHHHYSPISNMLLGFTYGMIIILLLWFLITEVLEFNRDKPIKYAVTVILLLALTVPVIIFCFAVAYNGCVELIK